MLLPGGLAPSPALAAPWLVGWVAAVSVLVLTVRHGPASTPGHARARVDGAHSRPAGWSAPIAAAVGISLLAALVTALVMPSRPGRRPNGCRRCRSWPARSSRTPGNGPRAATSAATWICATARRADGRAGGAGAGGQRALTWRCGNAVQLRRGRLARGAVQSVGSVLRTPTGRTTVDGALADHAARAVGRQGRLPGRTP